MPRPAKPFVLGAVAYDAKVVTIWDGFRAFFARAGFPFDYVLYSNYEAQVEAHLRGELDVTWNSPLAWLETERAARQQGRPAHAIAMRDTDRDLTSVILVAIDDDAQSLADLRDRSIGVGAADSPQATLIPLEMIAAAGLHPGEDLRVVRHDVLVGKHGDHIGGERDALRALARRTVDAAAIIDVNHLAFQREGTIPLGSMRILAQTGTYDHCNMTVLGEPPDAPRFAELLFAMSYDDPQVRPLLDLEGLHQWLPGRTEGYALLAQAIDRFGTIADWLATQA